MASTEALSDPALDISSLGRWTIDRIMEWSDACGRFLKWEQDHMMARRPTARERQDHQEALTWLLRITKLYYVTVSDPQFPDRSVQKELRGRVRQLEDSWQMFYDNPLSDAEAEKLLAEVFPDEPGT